MVTYDAEVDFTIPFEGGNIELPRINPEYAGKLYRYAYGIHSKQKGYFADSIIKVDTDDQSVKVWTPETRHLPSEPIFAKRPGGEGEDDGVLLTVVMSQKEKRSSLVLLDAVTLEEIARAKMPIVMGYGFHGAWGTG
jgi:torulene dioxygenase